MFRLLVVVVVFWALMSSGLTPVDLGQAVAWVLGHVRLTVE